MASRKKTPKRKKLGRRPFHGGERGVVASASIPRSLWEEIAREADRLGVAFSEVVRRRLGVDVEIAPEPRPSRKAGK